MRNITRSLLMRLVVYLGTYGINVHNQPQSYYGTECPSLKGSNVFICTTFASSRLAKSQTILFDLREYIRIISAPEKQPRHRLHKSQIYGRQRVISEPFRSNNLEMAHIRITDLPELGCHSLGPQGML